MPHQPFCKVIMDARGFKGSPKVVAKAMVELDLVREIDTGVFGYPTYRLRQTALVCRIIVAEFTQKDGSRLTTPYQLLYENTCLRAEKRLIFVIRSRINLEAIDLVLVNPGGILNSHCRQACYPKPAGCHGKDCGSLS